MCGLGVGHERAVLQAGARGAGRQAGAAAVRRAAGAGAGLAHRHLGPHGAPAHRAHRLIRYYKPDQAKTVL